MTTLIEELLEWEAARVAPPSGFPALPEISAQRYWRPDFYQLEMDHVWTKSWLCVGLEAGLLNPGEYRCFDKVGAPKVLVRGKDGTLRAFYNSCRHRGAPVARGESGKVGMFRCRYHSWSYDLAGRLISLPDERDFACLVKADHGLIAIKCETVGGLVFINEDANAVSLKCELGALWDDLDVLKLEKMRLVEDLSHRVTCNWKVVMDAFVEVYHVQSIHQNTVASSIDTRAIATELYPRGHSRMSIRWRPGKIGSFPEITRFLPDVYMRNSINPQPFPNMTIAVDPYRIPILLIWPISPDECELEILFLVLDWGDAEKPAYIEENLAGFRITIEEDLENLAQMQATMRSSAFPGPFVSYQERKIYWYHEEIDRRIGADRVPKGLAVRQILGDSVREPAVLG